MYTVHVHLHVCGVHVHVHCVQYTILHVQHVHGLMKYMYMYSLIVYIGT